MTEVVVDVPRVAPGTNELMRMNKWDRRDLKVEFYRETMVAWKKAGGRDVPNPCEVTYMRSYWNDGHRMDMDNLACSFKMFGDALAPTRAAEKRMRREGAWLGRLLPDDSPEVIRDLHVRDQKLHKDEHPVTRLVIRGVET